jgi:outer membrane protein TolC
VAQDRPTTNPGSATISLDEALSLAQGSNPAYRRIVAARGLTEVENREFWLGLLPQPQVSLLRTNMQWNRQSVGTDNFGNPIPNPDFRMIQSASSSQSVFLNFQLNPVDFFARRTTRVDSEVRELQIVEGGFALESEVKLAYLNAQERMQSQDLEGTLLAIARENHDITQQLFRLAQVDRPDLLNAEIDLLDQEHQLAQSESGLRSALLRLRIAIGDPALGDFQIEPVALRLFDPSTLDAEALIGAAVSTGPRVQEAELGVRREETLRSVQRAEWLPDLVVSAGMWRDEFSLDSGSGFLEPLPSGDWSRRISLTLQFPDVGMYFNRQNSRRRTEIGIEGAEETVRERRFAVEEEVGNLLVQLANEFGTVELQERRVELANERLALEQERYRLGMQGSDYLALQSSAETAASAQRAALQARYAFERTLIQIERLLGSPVEAPAVASTDEIGRSTSVAAASSR